MVVCEKITENQLLCLSLSYGLELQVRDSLRQRQEEVEVLESAPAIQKFPTFFGVLTI